MADCIIRGDLANVRIGRHCVISQKTVIRPPFKKFSKGSVKLYNLFVGLVSDLSTLALLQAP